MSFRSGVMSLLRPLLLDIVPSVQQTAALALGRLANYSDDLAEAVVKGDILPQLVYSLAEQNRFYKKAAAFVLRAVAKHSPPLAQVGGNILNLAVFTVFQYFIFKTGFSLYTVPQVLVTSSSCVPMSPKLLGHDYPVNLMSEEHA